MQRDNGTIISVVDEGLCLQCGTCYSICPKSCITLKRDSQKNYVPVVNEKNCSGCRLCLRACPGIEVDFRELAVSQIHNEQRRTNPLIGEYIGIFVGYSKNEEIREGSSSGGIVPQILLDLLETRRIDGALVVGGTTSPFNPKVFIARTEQEILGSIQSKYHPVCLNSKLKEIERHTGKYALVGLPCHIHGLRKYGKFKKIEQKIVLTIGVFCAINLRFDSLEFFARKVGQSAGNLKRISYREGRWPGRTILEFTGKDRHAIDKNIVNHIYTLPRCLYCIDHTNELADISCGDAWLPELLEKKDMGWSAIICRSLYARQILTQLAEKKRVFLMEIDGSKLVESQHPMLCFKKKSLWLRMKIARLLGKEIPEYNRGPLKDAANLAYITGNVLLICVNHIMQMKTVKSLVNDVPLIFVKVYALIISKTIIHG